MTTTDVENYPGFAEPIQGPWLMEQMRAQAENVGARIEGEHVVALELGQRPFVVRCDSGRTLAAEAIILATGAKAKYLGLPSEEAFKGFGVSACATCDGFFFRGKKVAVIGGGNTAVEEALHLSNLAAHVTVVHRRDFVPGGENPARAARLPAQCFDPVELGRRSGRGGGAAARRHGDQVAQCRDRRARRSRARRRLRRHRA